MPGFPALKSTKDICSGKVGEHGPEDLRIAQLGKREIKI